MNKLPTKQIYLLAVIVIGIIALSVYSTYALFTFESSTSDVVSIHTPKSLTISENIYEYQQITIEPNKTTTTDIDIYNAFDYEVCYSIWYKIIENNIDINKVQIFELSSSNLTSSGTLNAKESLRVTIAIINDNDEPVKINLGTIGAKTSTDSCSLNLASDKNQLISSYSSIKSLNETILEQIDLIKEEPENYLTYPNETATITYKSTSKIFISDKFTYSDELFTLEEPTELTIEELANKLKLETNDIYFCKEDDKCSILYKITSIEKEERKISDEPETIEIYYHINLYDKLIGYKKGVNGLRKINDTDYVFYGDHPSNYLYYNCQNESTESCELWRIIGIFHNQKTNKYNLKIIKDSSIGKYQFNSSSNDNLLVWNNTNLYKYLNEEYKFINNYDLYLEELPTNIETITNNQITSTKSETNTKVNILSLSEYLTASTCQKNNFLEYDEECLNNNWLNNLEIEKEWSSTTKTIQTDTNNNLDELNSENEATLPDESTTNSNNDNEDNQDINKENSNSNKITTINYAYRIGSSIDELSVDTSLDIRPVVYLKSRILYVAGDGSYLSPFVIK